MSPDPKSGREDIAARPLRVLLVDDGAHRTALLRTALAEQGCEVVGVIDSAPALHESVARLKADVVIVDSESPSRGTLEHLATLSVQNPRPVVVFAEEDAEEPMQRALAAGVSAYVVAGLQPGRLGAVLRVALARFAQDQAMRRQLAHAQDELGARKQVERAKGILMKVRGVAEDQAYQQLRRMAMDRGEKLVHVAARVIAAHELLGPGG